MSHMLDTHIAVQLFQGKTAGLSRSALLAVDRAPLFISPVVVLELEMLREIGRIKLAAKTVIEYLQHQLDIRLATDRLSGVVVHASRFAFTRDPFDRLIVGHAALIGMKLITRDENILRHFAEATD